MSDSPTATLAPPPPTLTATPRQARPQTAPEERVEKLPPYNVVLLNDEEHTYAYVVEMLQRLFGVSFEQAYQLTLTVDTVGRAVCKTTHKELAELKRDQIHGYGRDFLMATSKGSMSAIIEPAFADGDPSEGNS